MFLFSYSHAHTHAHARPHDPILFCISLPLFRVPDQEAQSIFEAKFPMEVDACKNKVHMCVRTYVRPHVHTHLPMTNTMSDTPAILSTVF